MDGEAGARAGVRAGVDVDARRRDGGVRARRAPDAAARPRAPERLPQLRAVARRRPRAAVPRLAAVHAGRRRHGAAARRLPDQDARRGGAMTELDRKQDRSPVPAGWTYAPAPESRDIVTVDDRYGHYVGGEWLDASETYTTLSPSSEEPLAEVGQATEAEVGQAVDAARAAFENGWSALPGAERAKYMFRIARILQERAREFAVL